MTREDIIKLLEVLAIIIMCICCTGVIVFLIEKGDAHRNAQPVAVTVAPASPLKTVADLRSVIRKIRVDNETFYVDTRSGRTWYRPDGNESVIEIDPIASLTVPTFATATATATAEALPIAGN